VVLLLSRDWYFEEAFEILTVLSNEVIRLRFDYLRMKIFVLNPFIKADYPKPKVFEEALQAV